MDYLIKELRRKLEQPSVCPATCADCCSRPVLMLYTEWSVLQHPGKYQAGKGNCPFLAESHCTIYRQRPLPCRWHGLAQSGENFCAGIRVEALPTAHIEDIRHRWTLALYRQMGEVIFGRRRNAERLAWWRYCLQISEGARIDERLREAA